MTKEKFAVSILRIVATAIIIGIGVYLHNTGNPNKAQTFLLCIVTWKVLLVDLAGK